MGLDYQQIGQRMAARRKRLGLRQAQVCERCDINSNYLSNIERAKSIPSLEVFMRICDALETTPDALLLGAGRGEDWERERVVAEQLRGLNHRQLELVECFIRWTEEQAL